MVGRYANLFKIINIFFDYAILNIAMVLTYLEMDSSKTPFIYNKQYFPIVLSINLIWLFCANLTGLYDSVLNKNSVKTFQSLYKTYLLFAGFVFVTIVLVIGTNFYNVSRSYLLFSILLYVILICLWKFIFLVSRRLNKSLIDNYKTVIIIGARSSGYKLQTFFDESVFNGYKVIGYFDDKPELENVHYLGNYDAGIEYMTNHYVDEVFCALPSSERIVIKKMLQVAEKNMIRFRIVPEYHEYLNKPTYLLSFGNIPVIAIRHEPLENIVNRLIKRIFDVIFSLFVILFVLSWLIPILAIIIKLESKGPVFFSQLRPGLYHKPFKCFKFRSMKVNKESDHLQATKGDSRITKVGAFLRKTSIDELPQFFNVLIGNMSVVGPRPNMMVHTEQYSMLIDKFMVRHFVKPGITGWAQINGFRGETKTTEAMAKRVEADVWYIENWSFFLDVQIIVLTIWNMIVGEENAF